MSLRQRLARAIVSRYPSAWRERYEQEILGLIEDVPPRWRDLLDLWRGSVVERARALFEPAAHPILTLLVAGTGRYLVVPSAIVAISFGFGSGLKATLGTLSEQALDRVGWTFVATMLVCVSGYLTRGLHRWRTGKPNWSIGLPGSLIWLCMAVVFCVTQVWAGTAGTSTLFHSLYHIAIATSLVVKRLPAPRMQRLVELTDRLLGAREMVGKNGWARLELTRCETLAAHGQPVADELARARAEFDRWQNVHDDALRALQSMGYRARFQENPSPDSDQ